MRLGIISDTHGLLRPRVLHHLADVDRILHAGDVGDSDILTELEALAPVTAVVGNTDTFPLVGRLAQEAHLTLEGPGGAGDYFRIGMLHGHLLDPLTPQTVADAFPEAHLVIYGHTHRPLVEWVGQTLVLNPGSAGPRRFRLPATMALVELTSEGASPTLIPLDDSSES